MTQSDRNGFVVISGDDPIIYLRIRTVIMLEVKFMLLLEVLPCKFEILPGSEPHVVVPPGI